MSFESAVVSFVIQKLGDMLIEEAKFLSGVEDRVQSLKREFEWMQSYLKDVDEQEEEGNERLHRRILEIRKIAYDAEDLIESLIIEGAATKRETLLKRCACFFNCLVRTHKVGTEIEAIKMRVHESTEMLQKYQAGGQDGRIQKRLRRSYPHSNDDYVVGLEGDIKMLVEQMIGEKNQAKVLCIVGMGGSGKTTLARKLYNHETVKQYFHCQAWVSVSQEWNTQHILVEILRQAAGITQKIDEMVSIEGLVDKLQDYLKHKLYLIVLDDVWKKDALEDMLPAFPFGNKGSKVIITTRNREVFEFPNLLHFFHEPRRLTEDESWELFSKIALNHNECIDDYQQIGDFEKLGKEMLKKCEGLPLAIIALGGLLGAKGTTEEWEKVSKVVSSKVMGGRGTHTYGTVKDMLALSYQDLPYDLKPCFLYVALFPEDSEIRVSILKKMWISEGFIMSQEETLEEAARECLDELIQRCVVQVATRNYAGKVKTIRIHDLMRDLCIKKAKELNFLEVFHRSAAPLELNEDVTRSQSRRCIIYSYSSMCVQFGTQNFHLRSLFLYGPALVGFNSYSPHQPRGTLSLELVHKNFRLLRVLNIVGFKTSDGIIPVEIGNLIHLRYLRIMWTNIRELPESIGNLRNLLTLDYRLVECFPYKVRVPNVLWKLERLRHLFLPWGMPSITVLKLSTLKSLQILSGVTGGNWMLNEMLTLSPSVKRLVIRGISRKEQLMAVFQCQSIILDQLYNLYMDWHNCDEKLKLQNLELLCHCQNLRKLQLDGRIGEEPSPVQFPSNLKKITLCYTNLTLPVTMENLGRLANLKYIHLSWDSYMGTKWTCRAGEFPQLEWLGIRGLHNLEEWRVERGAMSRLTELEIYDCRKLKELSEGLKFIGSLRRLVIHLMPEAFCRRLQQEDLHIIQHIPTVRIKAR